MPILPKERDPRLITIRRGGTLTDDHHRLLADWALLCAEHVLHLFEEQQPGDSRPRDAIEVGRAWIRGELRMTDAHNAAFQANAAARGMADPAKFAALSAGQAVAVAHVAAHDLGAAAYAIRAAGASASQPTTPRKLGPRNGNGSGSSSLPPSVTSFSMINDAGAPSAGTSSTTDHWQTTRSAVQPHEDRRLATVTSGPASGSGSVNRL